ncbi:glycosyltransferase family 4 protein [Marinilabilia salmonicolor]|uniref:glycosyltransferase family 4 protein n=1 Tax=Marinilabilia salmonicolor TaxID=989 RepID=UPI00029A23E6|nr:glycosyltransferase family 4 protein [Marinilabilia salmonicolor]
MKNRTANKALCVLNFSGRFGGAEKRYATLFNRLMTDGADYYMVMNTRLYRLLVSSSVLLPHERIVLFNDGGDGVAGPAKSKRDFTGGGRASIAGKMIRFGGSCKYFLKTFLLWLRFSFFFIRKVNGLNIKKIYAVWQGGIWTWMWCRGFGIDLVYSVNASDKLMLYNSVLKFFDSQYWILQHATHLDFLSPSLVPEYQRAMGVKLKGEKLVTPCSFVDYSNYYPVEPKKPWVVFLGRLEPLKNPELFLEAVAILAVESTFQEVTFFVMGTGSEQQNLQQFVVDRGLQNVVFSGLHPHPWEILQQSSVFVSLQNSENYPSQSLLEAMACENGVVVTDVGDTRMLVTEKEGMLVAVDSGEVADAIRLLMENAEFCKTLGRAAREKVTSMHTLERFVAWFNQVMRF